MNLTKYRVKQSTLEHQVNISLLLNLILMLAMAGSLALANYHFSETKRDTHWYLFDKAPSSGEISLASFFSFYLVLNSFVPIDLVMLVEASKFL